jgi:hypothetical protein
MTGPDTRRSGRDLLLRRVLPLLLVLAAALGLFLFLQRGNDDQATPGAAATSSEVSAPSSDQPEEAEPTGSPSPAVELPAPTVAAREGVPASARTVTVSDADFAAAAEWSDGATVRVADARQQVTSGVGPGERSGQPQTVFDLEVTNGSGEPLDLNAVVVQAVYGGSNQASPLYDRETVDFGGTLAPGETATAVYSFAIPADQLGDVVLSVDVDGYRFPAVFAGAVPAS